MGSEEINSVSQEAHEETPENNQEKEDQILKEMTDGIEGDLKNVEDSEFENIDPSYSMEIGLKIKSKIEEIRDIYLSDGIKDAYSRVEYLLENENLPQESRYLELSKALQSLKEESSDSEESVDEDSKSVEMVKEIIEGLEKEFDDTNPERNDATKMQDITHKLFVDISKVRDLAISNDLKDTLGRASYLENKADNISKEEVIIELKKIVETL